MFSNSNEIQIQFTPTQRQMKTSTNAPNQISKDANSSPSAIGTLTQTVIQNDRYGLFSSQTPKTSKRGLKTSPKSSNQITKTVNPALSPSEVRQIVYSPDTYVQKTIIQHQKGAQNGNDTRRA